MPPTAPQPTAVFIHAHPDDESLFTGGRTVLGARAGQRQVLVTMTDGSLGFDPAGHGPLELAHDREATATCRALELEVAAAILGFDRVVQLGFRDSGMAGWPTGDEPGAFVRQPLELVARRVARVLAEEGPCEVVTYDATGFYGHPDHVFAHRAAMRVAELTDAVRRVEAVVMTSEDVERALTRAAAGAELPEWLGRRLVTLVPDDQVDVVIDARSAAVTKQAALSAHVSQIDNRALVALSSEVFEDLFGRERYATLWAEDVSPGR